jgi:RNA-directed DNA polymerase
LPFLIQVLSLFIQQAIAQKLNPIFDKSFSDQSYGFRPNRSAQMAIEKAKQCVDEGKRYVVDIDLEKFFDRVNHDLLMSRIARKFEDKATLKLIRSYLEAGIMVDGMTCVATEGTPWGSPISVLLSNVYLHYVLDLWFDKVVKPKMQGECYLIRYLDDFVVCFQYRADSLRFQEVISKRLAKMLPSSRAKQN